MTRKWCFVILGVVLGCAKGSLTYAPAIAVFVKDAGLKELGSGESVAFTGESQSKAFEIRNIGDRPLQVQRIYVEPEGGAFSVDLGSQTLPIEIEPVQGAYTPKFEFYVFYDSKKGDEEGHLFIESNDPTNRKFEVVLVPGRLEPQISVSCGPGPVIAQTPIGKPWTLDVIITNVGKEALVIKAPVVLEDQSEDEFQILNPPKVGTPIYPKGSGLGEEQASFTLRYLPKDVEEDRNSILIQSNDPKTPLYKISIVGRVSGEADIVISHADQYTTGCVDFTKITEGGQQCTKVVKVELVGDGNVVVQKPRVDPENGPYSVEWYKAGGTHEADENGCGPYGGTKIEAPQFTLTPQNRSLDVAVTYTAPGAKGMNGTLIVSYTASVPGQKEVQLCGGVAKGEIDVSPPFGRPLVFFARSGETKKKTVVVMNKGIGSLLIKRIEAVMQFPLSDPKAFRVLDAPTQEVEIPAFSLLPVTVEFNTDYEQPVVNGAVVIRYLDPLTGADNEWRVTLVGHNNDFEDVELPVANPGSPADYANAKAGQPIVLDGSKSTSGTFEFPSTGNTGFRWFLIGKPTGSRVFLNIADSGPKQLFTPDVPGTYKFGLDVYACDPSNTCYVSDEATLSIDVSP